MMGNNCLKKHFTKTLLFIIIAMVLYCTIFTKFKTFAQTNTDSEYVNTVNDLKTTTLPGGVTLYEQKMASLVNGDDQKAFEEHYVQWVDVDNSVDYGLKLATWTYMNPDKWYQATTKRCATNWESYHPGWIVVAGTNGDFFRNTGTTTFEPTNNFMADGNMYRADLVGGYRGVIGINDDNEIIYGDPTMTGLQLEVTKDDVVTKYDFAGYNCEPTDNGIYLYTKDHNHLYNFTGYKVYVGKYELCRIDDDKEQRVYVKGEITNIRDGEENEKPVMEIQHETEDGKVETKKVREFFIVTKDEAFLDILLPNTQVRCQHNYTGDWENVTQSTGFIHQMLSNGVSNYQKSTDSFIYTNHPRTFFGIKEDGTPVMMVIDGRGKTAAEKNFGVSLFQGAEIMKLAGAYNAFNFDGGGSSTLVVRNENDDFNVINRPSDGGERATGNAIFLVMRDPGFVANNLVSTPTSVTLNKKTGSLYESFTNISIEINGNIKQLNNTDNTVTFDGLDPNTEYSAIIRYKYENEECVSNVIVKTTDYQPEMKVTSNSYGFTIDVIDNNEILKVTSAQITIDDNQVLNMPSAQTFVINDLFMDEEYQLSFLCTVYNTLSKKQYQIKILNQSYRTLDYEEPLIKQFEQARKTSNSIRFRYDIKDESNLITKISIFKNDLEISLNDLSGSYTFNDLDFTKETYRFKMQIEFVSNEQTKTITTKEIVYEKEEHVHEIVIDQKVDATCTKEGLTEGSHCKTCNQIITPQEKLEALGHNWIEATKNNPKTCSICGITEGEKLKNCKKSSLLMIVISINLFTSLILLRKRK